nr:MAG TPA: hypothetical protein [Caudoviricetes sp.]
MFGTKVFPQIGHSFFSSFKLVKKLNLQDFFPQDLVAPETKWQV